MDKLIKKSGVILAGLAVSLVVAGGHATESRAEDAEYRNTMNMERFIDSLKDPKEVEFANTMTLEKFINAMKDPCQTDEHNLAIILAKCEDMERSQTAYY